MQRSRAFTLTEMITSIVLVVFIFGLSHAIIGCGGGDTNYYTHNERGKAMSTKSMETLRGIVHAFTLYAPANGGWYPGLTRTGEEDKNPLTGDNIIGTTSASGFDPTYRMTLLLRHNYITPQYAISPFEGTGVKTPANETTPVTTANFSWAMLRIDQQNSNRRKEWRTTLNANAAVMSDRNIAPGTGSGARSILAEASWIGAVAFNDGHVVSGTTSVMASTEYAGTKVDQDDIFTDNAAARGKANSDAAMVYQDSTSYVNQK